jgi:tetratricopeptide (TPR) repeat protein
MGRQGTRAAFWPFLPLAFAAALLAPTGFALDATEQLQFADGLYARGMWDTALREYQALLPSNTNRALEGVIQFRMGECFRAVGRTNEAYAAYQKSHDAAPEGEYRYRAGLRMAELLEQEGRLEDQVRLLQALLDGKPEPALAAACRYALGLTLERQGKAAEAAAAFETVLVRHPGTPHVGYAALALAGMSRKTDGARALQYYHVAFSNAASPRVAAEALLRIADLHYAMKEYEPAARAYERLAADYPADESVPRSRLQMAWSFYHAGLFADALKACEAAVKAPDAQPANPAEWLYLKANCERQLMKQEAAVTTYERLLQAHPQAEFAEGAAYERALTLYKMGRFQDAIAQARTLTLSERIKRDVYWLLAECSEAVKDEAGAVQYYRLLVDQFPGAPLAGDALYRLAFMTERKGDSLKAAEWYGKMAESYTGHELAPQAHYLQGVCLNTAGQREQAVAAWTRLVERHPQGKFAEEGWYQKAMGEVSLRRDAQALASWRELMARFPGTKYLADASFWTGVLQEEAGKFEEAETAFRAALRASASEDLQQRARLRLALVLQRRNRPDESADLLQGVLATPLRDKVSPELLEWLGEYRLGRREYALAAGIADPLLAKAADDAWRQIAWRLKGKALMGQGQNGPARQAFERVTGIDVKSQALAESWLCLGELALADHDAAKARGAFDEAALLSGDEALLGIRVKAYAGIARALKAQGDSAGAARHFMSVAILFDDPVLVPQCLYEAAQAFEAAGRSADSEKARKELKDRYPDSEWAARP